MTRARDARAAEARRLYVGQALSLAQVAARMGAGERTVARWKADALAAGDAWDRARTARRMGGSQDRRWGASHESVDATTQDYLGEFLDYQREALADMRADASLTAQEKVAAVTSLTDAYVKAVRACALTAPALGQLAVAVDVLRRMTDYVQERCPDLAPALLDVLEPFAVELERAYG
jgi:hypothetical protein